MKHRAARSFRRAYAGLPEPIRNLACSLALAWLGAWLIGFLPGGLVGAGIGALLKLVFRRK